MTGKDGVFANGYGGVSEVFQKRTFVRHISDAVPRRTF